VLSQGLIPTAADADAFQTSRAAAAPVQRPPAPECPDWCATGHNADVNGPGLWSRNHCRTPQYVDLQGYPGAFAMVYVCTRDTWTPSAPTAWKREDRAVVISPERGAEPITIWNVPTLRPILKSGPLLMPGLLDLITEAVQFCGIKIPAEYM
jgi:hypothetical protein